MELVVVLRGNDAADYDGHVFVAEFREGLAECGHKGEVTGGKRTWSDDIDVFFDGLARGLFGRLKQGAKNHVESEIRKSRTDHLLTAVMTVLTELADEDARLMALFQWVQVPRGASLRPEAIGAVMEGNEMAEAFD